MILDCIPLAPPVSQSKTLQIIGTKTMRVSGIQMSRSAYTYPLKRIFPDLIEVSHREAVHNRCDINLWAVRAMSPATLREVRAQPGKNIWCIVLESSELQPGVKETAASMDQVWVPTSFVRDVCIRGGIPEKKIRIIPYYLARPPRPRVLPAISDPFTVLVSWDDASNMERKNVVNSIKAFKLAWPDDTLVRLKLKTRDLRESNRILLEDAINGDPRIVINNEFVESCDEIFDGVHVLLHIHRAEGYGRHTIEAMQRELPMVVTSYSGCMDWLTERNSLLVGYTMVPTDQKLFQYPVDGAWADPDIEQTVNHLLWCRSSYTTLVPEMTAQAKKDAARAVDMSRVVAEMRSALRGL